ncbi:MAG: alpha-amylase family glycosyl hydrolase [Candidatus Ornithospirochaeta sp.]|nr:alpha-amylase family glycosyl hydrolase [Candidatus Ornithospirochaeta sp.]
MERKWWKEGCVYQIYPRSFYDSNGDGIGDLKGIEEKLGYVKDLGASIIWLNPCYKSPNDDNGYDISDYRAIMDDFGTMEDFDSLLSKAHSLGLKVIMDLVVNHTSDEHEWFIKSSSSRDGEKSDWYIWRDKGNNWGACFGGSAWEYSEKRDQYYLHCFSRKQPDLNWENPEVRNAVYDMMNYWGDKGIDGFRMDVITMISKDQAFPDGEINGEYGDPAPYTNNGPRVHEFLKEMNEKSISRYDWLTVGEGAGARVEDTLSYTMPENRELNMIFSFEHMNYCKPQCSNNWKEEEFSLPEYKRIYRKWQEGLDGRGWNTLYLENHDQVRSVSRYGDTSTRDLWKKSAKALAAMYFLMQGTPYIYMGQELGMTNTDFGSIDEFRDIAAKNDWSVMLSRGFSEHDALRLLRLTSRDNSRTPFPWTPEGGFSESESWIRYNQDMAFINAESEEKDPDSVLSFYKRMIALRASSDALIYGSFELLDEDDEDVFSYRRRLGNESYIIAVNMSSNVRHYPLKGETVLSNYSDGCDDLRSWEAKVVKEEMMDFIAFGEILFDVFPDKATLGGAPLNVAGHMSRLGLRGSILSAVGNDELGARA